MLKKNRHNVSFRQARIGQRPDQEDMRIGAMGDRDRLALQILDPGDPGVGAGHQSRPFRL